MRLILLGGAPGVGKTTVGRELLGLAAGGTSRMQWVDVDALWRHQPWRVDEVTITMLKANLVAVMSNADAAGMDTVLVTWVFQDTSFHDLVVRLAPAGTQATTIQLRLEEDEWRCRFGADPARPPIDAFFLGRYHEAQSTPADHIIEVAGLDPLDTAQAVLQAVQLSVPPGSYC